MSTTSTIKIIYWNPNGILTRIHELYYYMIANHIDVACLCETFLKFHTNPPSHPDFTLHRRDRIDGIRGGIAISIKKIN